MVSVTQSDVVRYLNEYLFDTVWNSSSSEYRVNLTLLPLRDRLQSSAVSLRRTVVGLPTTDTAYMTYWFPFTLFLGSVTLPYNTWVNSLSLLGTSQSKLTFYDVDGRVISGSHVWLLYPEGSSDVIVAITKRGLVQCTTQGLASTVYLTVFKDPTLLNDISATSFDLTTTAGTALANANTNIKAFITTCLSENANGVFVYVNGFDYDPSNVPALNTGDLVDVILDRNVIGQFTVTVDDNVTGYQSTMYNGYREILHCPKALNPNNQILTHDSITLTVRDASTGKGVYLHRQNPIAVKQITHNDFSVDRQMLDTFTNGLKAPIVQVNVKIRTTAAPRELQSDAFYIDDLYLLDDEAIVSMLQGSSDSTMTFWQAAQIEQSSYIGFMYNNAESTDPATLDSYVAAMGYYKIAAILSANVYSGKYNSSVLVIDKPFIMTGQTCFPMVYVNGRKVPQSFIDVKDVSSTKLEIFITQGYPVKSGDDIIIRVFNGGSTGYTRFLPSGGGASVVVQNSDISVFQEVAVETPVSGYKRSTATTYVPVAKTNSTYQIFSNADGTSSVTFMPGTFGKKMLIQNSSFMYAATHNIDTMLAGNEPLVFKVEATDSAGNGIPLAQYGSCEVYLNGYQLVNNIDYILSPKVVQNGIALMDVVVMNRNFINLSATGNTVEIFVHSDLEVAQDLGYSVENTFYRESRPSVWYAQVGNLTVEGIQKLDVYDQGLSLVSQSNVADGSVFQMSIIYPKQVLDVLSNYSGLGDQQRITTIDTYLGRNVPAIPSVIPISIEHSIYSPWLTAIINDIVDGTFLASNDPNQQTFLVQFSAYDYLKDRDPTLVANNRVDRRFVAVAASYAQFPPTSPLNATIIRRLINYTLVAAANNLGETLA